MRTKVKAEHSLYAVYKVQNDD